MRPIFKAWLRMVFSIPSVHRHLTFQGSSTASCPSSDVLIAVRLSLPLRCPPADEGHRLYFWAESLRHALFHASIPLTGTTWKMALVIAIEGATRATRLCSLRRAQL